MAYLSLYRKYRPQTFAEILGQEHVAQTLANALVEERVAHAYLFTGPRGTGKTSTARILAKALNCDQGPTPSPCGVCGSCVAIAEGSSLDVIEMDAASHSKVDETREILAGVPLATAGGRRKVYVIDEVHMLTTQSFNALLKTLEEPPPHVVFVLATTEAHKVLPTIVSRTQRFDFRRIPTEVLEAHLAEVAAKEGIDIEPGALGVIARHADGSARDALGALDQLANLGGTITAEDAERLLGGRFEDALSGLFDAIAHGDVGRVFTTVGGLMVQGADPRRLCEGALEHARALLLLKAAPAAGELLDAATEDRARLAGQAERFSAPALLRTLELLARSLTEMRSSPNHRLWLEVALVRAAAPDTDPAATGLLGRIERLERRIGIDGAAAAGPEPAPSRPEPARTPVSPAAEPAPVPAHPAAEAAPAAAEAAAVGLAQIRDAWGATLRTVAQASKRVAALLNPSRPLSYEGDVLVIEVQSPFHQGSMAQDPQRALLADALYATLGIRPQLSFAAAGRPTSAPEAEQAVTVEATEPAEDDPVELIKKRLGGEVVEERREELKP
jgi:DNA polymerase-3 subunit gamma/tau